MSVALIVIPVVSGAWPVIAGLAAVAATRLGYKVLQGERQIAHRIDEQVDSGVVIPVNENEILAEGMRPDETMTLVKDDYLVTISRDARGQLSIHVDSDKRTKAEQAAEGERIVNSVRRQFAYVKTVQSLKQKGFTVTEEEVEEDGKIRLFLRRFTGGER